MSTKKKTRRMSKHTNGIWYTRLMVKGVEVRETTRTSDRTLALTILSKRMVERAEGKYLNVKHVKTVKFHELCDAYMKTEGAESCTKGLPSMIEALKVGLGNVPVRTLTASKIKQFLLDRKAALTAPKPVDAPPDWSKKGFSDSTRNRYVSCIKRLFSWGIANHIVDINPASSISKLEETGKRHAFFTNEQIEYLQNDPETPVHMKRFIIAGLHTGMRRSEILQLKWSDIDLQARDLIVTQSKAGRSRHIPINDVLCAMLEGLPSKDVGGWVFPSEKDSEQPTKDFNHCWRKAAKRAGLGMAAFHGCRHTFGSVLVANGVPIYTVSILLGHGSTRTTEQFYLHLAPRQTAGAVGILNNAYKVKSLASDEPATAPKIARLRTKPSQKPSPPQEANPNGL